MHPKSHLILQFWWSFEWTFILYIVPNFLWRSLISYILVCKKFIQEPYKTDKNGTLERHEWWTQFRAMQRELWESHFFSRMSHGLWTIFHVITLNWNHVHSTSPQPLNFLLNHCKDRNLIFLSQIGTNR